MPRKAGYDLGYDDDDYGYYDDYGYDEDADEAYGDNPDVDGYVEEETPNIFQTASKPGTWSCPICTFANDEELSACDICGVLRDPIVSNNGSNKKSEWRFFHAADVSKGYGASILARALLAPLPRRTHEMDVIIQRLNASFMIDSVLQEDLVKFGKHSAMKFPQGNTVELSSSRASSGISEKKEKVNQLPRKNKLKAPSAGVPEVGQPSSYGRNGSSLDDDNLQTLNNSFNKVKMSADSGSSQNRISTQKAKSVSPYKPEKWMLPDQDGKLTQLNLAIVGHVDSGKSTLSGRLLNLLGRISQKEMHKYEKEAKQQGKGSFAFAWAMDESAEERERGITMTVGVAYFDSKKYHVVVLDSPGHKDFVPNMISGATQADAAILVIDASMGAFEAGIDANGGQTREHAQLIRSFGVDQVIVADSFLSWIPLSAMENQNLVTAASDARLSSWYEGPYLLDAVDSLQPPVRDVSKPLRMPICDFIKSQSLGQLAVSGKLESGAIRNGSKVMVLPYGDVATVRTIERDSKPCSIARSGDNVAVSLQGIDANRVMAGGVLCHPDFPVAIASCFELKVLVLDVLMPILIGSQIEFHVHHAKEAARVKKIVSLLDQKTGKVSKKAPRCLTSKQSALIEVNLDAAVCVEEFSECRALGRVFLRSSGRTIAVGIITRIIE
ncbi:hypothetical protein C5167_040940 [Papaver somniferum]|uniref:Tr-type G domain-containing protein n=1 Tax=Papaver somniferum TaxID=3469 RepID=A0A4Y7IJQ8_PAPSO|nr:hypothetical protein C5167_040940 [Papaver somniferum]